MKVKPARKGNANDAKRLLKLRNKMGLSQRELAEEFYVSAGAIAHWETGERPINGPVLKLIEIYEKKHRI